MRFLEFGKQNDKKIVMFHASCMTWDFLDQCIYKLAQEFHVIVPVMPGYDMEDRSDYTSVEEIAEETEQYLLEYYGKEIDGIYGISMGGSIVLRMLANGKIHTRFAVVDAGITPYQLPAFVSQLFVLRDYSFMITLKSSIKIFSLFVSKEKYGGGTFKGLREVMLHASCKTIWNNFKSCNTYSMPDNIKEPETDIRYWYGSKEKGNRRRDIRYVKEIFPKAVIEEIPDCNHAEFVMLQPEEFSKKISEFMGS